MYVCVLCVECKITGTFVRSREKVVFRGPLLVCVWQVGLDVFLVFAFSIRSLGHAVACTLSICLSIPSRVVNCGV